MSWRDLIERHHEWAHATDEYDLVTLPGISFDDIAEVEATLGFTFPREFVSLYRVVGGVGVKAGEDKRYWLFTPLKEIPGFVSRIRDWIGETHPDCASRFFPFIDWSDGDGSGYLVSSSGKVLPGLYHFEHDSFEFDPDQNEKSFLIPLYKSIDAFLQEK